LKRSIDYTDFTLNGLREGGMTVQKAGESLKDELRAIGETMTTEFLEAAGDEGKSVVEAYKAM